MTIVSSNTSIASVDLDSGLVVDGFVCHSGYSLGSGCRLAR